MEKVAGKHRKSRYGRRGRSVWCNTGRRGGKKNLAAETANTFRRSTGCEGVSPAETAERYPMGGAGRKKG